MPRRQPQTDNHGFNIATVVQMATIPVLTVAVGLMAFYYTTGATLTQHSKDIEEIHKREDQSTKSREAVTKQFMDYQQKSTELLGKLDTRLAVSETKMELTNQTLSKIADEITKLNVRAVR